MKALFDYKFETFIGIKVAGIAYIVIVSAISLGVALALLAAINLMTSYTYGDLFAQGLTLAISAPVIGFISLVFSRLALEQFVALIKIAENTSQDRS